MYIVVKLQGGESPGVKGDQVDFRVIQRCDRENGSEGIVSFEDDLCIWNIMKQYWSDGEGFFEHFEGFPAFWSQIPNNSFSSQMCEWNRDIRVVKK